MISSVLFIGNLTSPGHRSRWLITVLGVATAMIAILITPVGVAEARSHPDSPADAGDPAAQPR
jgi:hypothetical protein